MQLLLIHHADCLTGRACGGGLAATDPVMLLSVDQELAAVIWRDQVVRLALAYIRFRSRSCDL